MDIGTGQFCPIPRIHRLTSQNCNLRAWHDSLFTQINHDIVHRNHSGNWIPPTMDSNFQPVTECTRNSICIPHGNDSDESVTLSTPGGSVTHALSCPNLLRLNNSRTPQFYRVQPVWLCVPGTVSHQPNSCTNHGKVLDVPAVKKDPSGVTHVSQ